MEVRKLNSEGRYDVEFSDSQGRYYISAFNLSLGVWRGRRLEHNTHWLRWWDESGNLLLWGSEKIEQERQRSEQERQRAELAEAKIARLQARLRKAGITEEE